MDDLSYFFARHSRVALHFSAGKDSAACLKMITPWLEKVTVIWVCMGNPYPETVEYMQKIAAKVPHFAVVEGGQKAWVATSGYPVDILPITSGGADTKGPKLQSFENCCRHNGWEPLAQFTKEGRFSAVIRGQKAADRLKGPLRSGTVVEGVEYCFPLEDWTDEEVFAFVSESLPASYNRGLETSLDCINCTAYVRENRARLVELQKTFPDVWEEVSTVHKELKRQLENYTTLLGA